MKKIGKLLLSLIVMVSILTLAACGSSGKSSESSGNGSRDKITVLLRDSESSSKYLMLKNLLTEFSKEKGLKEPEFELVSNDADYITKLQLYMNSDTLPDLYAIPNGALSNTAKEMDAMVNIGEELKSINRFDDMNAAVVDFFKDADDGNMYIFPEGLYAEYFVYRKDIFEKYNLSIPTTWDEFMKVGEILKENNEVPLIVSGRDNWVLMRYLSFAPWRVTHDKFITDYIEGNDNFSSNEAAKTGVNLLYDLGKNNYFQPGFMGTDYTSAADLFFGGTGTMMYSNSGQMSLSEDMLNEGKLGVFPVPAVDGEDNIETNVPIHGGLGTAFNAKTYDSTMQEFFKYMVDNYSDECYSTGGIFSPFNDEIPEGLNPMFYEVAPLLENATQSWVSWDDKLDSAVLTELVSEQQKLAQGSIEPKEFEEKADSLIK